MKNIFSRVFKKTSLFTTAIAVGSVSAVLITSGYAALNQPVDLPDPIVDQQLLTPDFLNKIVGSVEDIDTRTNEILSKNGNVGIGKTDPSEKLDVTGNINSSGFVKGSQVCIGNDCRASWPTSGGGTVNDTDWTESNGNVFRLNGNVGIGTNDPTGTLDVFNNGFSVLTVHTDIGGQSQLLLAEGLDGPNPKVWDINAVDNGFGSYDLNVSNGIENIVTVSENGNVGIGTNDPKNKLHINGNTAGAPTVITVENMQSGNTNDPGINMKSRSSDYYIFANDETNQLYFWDELAGTQRMTIFGDGNVGINTPTPTQKLDVNGKIRMRTQTTSSDSNDTVATKGYVDNQNNLDLTECRKVEATGSAPSYTAYAQCNSDEVLLNGGGGCQNSPLGILHDSYPDLTNNRWVADCQSTNGTENIATATATCCKK